MMFSIGFTGTQYNMNAAQEKTLRHFFEVCVKKYGRSEVEFHHGDCIGADAQANAIAMEMGIKTVAHPPDVDDKRAFCPVNAQHEPKPYRKRNEDIVKSTKVLVATPRGSESSLPRSGTWMTVRIAKKMNRKVFIIDRDGSCEGFAELLNS